MNDTYYAPSITITLELEDGTERDLECEYYVEEEDPSVGIFGTDILVENVYWDDDRDAEVPDEIFPGREKEITELATEALKEAADAAMEP